MPVKFYDNADGGFIRILCDGKKQGIEKCLHGCGVSVGLHRNVGTAESPTLRGRGEGATNSLFFDVATRKDKDGNIIWRGSCGCHFFVENGEAVRADHPERNLRLGLIDTD